MLYDNKTGVTSVFNAFTKGIYPPKTILLASPFYSYPDAITKAVEKNCIIKLVVGLNDATKPEALRKIIDLENVQVRFFTSKKFHSKLYIFGDQYAVVGSANLTQSGLQGNQEVAVTIDKGQEGLFDDLVNLFASYWSEARPFGKAELKEFELIRQSYHKPADVTFENKIKETFGNIEPTGVRGQDKSQTAENIFLAEYRRTYQEFLDAYTVVEKLYSLDGRRKTDPLELPLRIEIDQFFNFLREEHARGNTYLNTGILAPKARETHIKEFIDKWQDADWPYLHEKVVEAWQKMNNELSSPEKLNSLSIEEIFDVLYHCHSFHDRRRFFFGGLPTFKQTFVNNNTTENVREALKDLLFGNAGFIERMADCLFSAKYEIKQFGRSNVQELLGWVNQENVPICNGRTLKALRFLGFDVQTYD